MDGGVKNGEVKTKNKMIFEVTQQGDDFFYSSLFVGVDFKAFFFLCSSRSLLFVKSSVGDNDEVLHLAKSRNR
jgi:hypothetical protein